MLARVSHHETAREFHRLSDAERLAKLQAAAEDISRRYAEGKLTAEQATEELRKLSRSASNGLLQFFGL